MKTQTDNAQIWIMDIEDPLNGEPFIEGTEVMVTAERSDTDEVSIHATFRYADNAVVSLYLTCAEAALLAAQVLRLSTEAGS